MKQNDEVSYTTEDLSELLQVSKLTVYDLIKKGEIVAYRVGRQMRVDATDFEAYKNRMKGNQDPVSPTPEQKSEKETTINIKESVTSHPEIQITHPIIVSGQDVTLDLLANAISTATPQYQTLRSHT